MSPDSSERNPQKLRKNPDYTGPLTARQVRFVEEYLIDLNGTKAAIRAGYSKKTARVIASQT